VAQGKSNAEIAAALFVGLRTVEAHVTHILNKLGFNSRAQIAVWAATQAAPAPPAPGDQGRISR
jgi:DNA-binding NarL/FixJ family response regulator